MLHHEVKYPQEIKKGANLAWLDSLNPACQLTAIEETLYGYSRAGNIEAVASLLKIITQIDAQHHAEIDEHDNPTMSIDDKGKEDISIIDTTNNQSFRALNVALHRAIPGNHIEIIRLLLRHGASPLQALRNTSFMNDNMQTTQLLLQHGGGIFSDFPKSLSRRNINANDCYVEGMSIGGIPVTRETPGFHRAIFNVDELAEYITRQNKLVASIHLHGQYTRGFRNFQQPLHCIKNAFKELESDPMIAENAAFKNAKDKIHKLGNVSSLQWIASRRLIELRDDIEINQHGSLTSLHEYLAKLDPKLSAAVFNVHADKQHAIALLNDRIDELQALHQHLEFILNTYTKKEKQLACLVTTGSCSTICSTTLFGIYTTIAFLSDICCEGCGPQIVTNSGKCSSLFVSRHALYFFGIPGMVISTVLLLSIAILITYRVIYGPGSVDCFFPIARSATINGFPDIQPILRTLCEILENEDLPDNVKSELQAITQPNATVQRVLHALINIRNHYLLSEIKQISEETSTKPYHAYKSDLFFWTEAQRAANRNNKLPSKMMMDETGTRTQHLLDDDLFTRIEANEPTNDDAAAPTSIKMNELGEPAGHTESTPLLGIHLYAMG